MKYAIIEKGFVKQVQTDANYKPSKNESIIKVKGEVCPGQLYDEKKEKFFNPKIIISKDEAILKLKEKTAKKIYSKYSKEKQSTYQIMALGTIEKVLQGKKLTAKDKAFQSEANKMKAYILKEIEKYKTEKAKIMKK